MKKWWFLVVVLFASNLFAQSEVILKYVTKTSTGQERILIVSDSTGSGYGYLPVKIMSGSTGGGGGSAGNYIVTWDSLTTVKLQTIIDSAHVKDSVIIARLNSLITQGVAQATRENANIYKASITTLTTEIDSINLSATEWYDGDVQLASGDTIKIKVSLSRTFPSDETWYVYPSQLYPIGRIDATSKPKIYFKRVASSGTANYQYRVRGR